MASDHRHITSGNLTPPILFLLLLFLLLVTPHHSSAQSPSSSNGSNSSSNNNNSNYFPKTNFHPSMAIVIIALISAFFFLGFFSIYIRQCADGRLNPRLFSSASSAAAACSRRQRGLDPDLLQTFPTLVYSEVKVLKIGKGSLECAVCLSEFEDDETLRLLPKCSHVFHPDCIDPWLAAHVTCPVCRSNLTADPDAAAVVDVDDHPSHQEINDPTATGAIAVDRLQESTAPVQDEVRVEIDGDEEEERKTEMENLERFVNMKRARSRARPVVMLPRSHSTGHSLVQPGQNLDRFTLRLPEDIRKEIVAAGTLKRATSLVAFRGERSMGLAGRSVRLGRSGQWGSFLSRTLSMKNWGRTRSRGAKPDQGLRSGSVKGMRFKGVIAPLDCYGSGGKSSGEESESSTAALNRV